MSGQPPPSENATGAQEDPHQHEIKGAISSSQVSKLFNSSKELAEEVDGNDLIYTANSDQHYANSNDIDDSEFAAAANNLAMYLSSLEASDGLELAPENNRVSQDAPQEPPLEPPPEPSQDEVEHNTASNNNNDTIFLEDDFEYNNLREMLEQAAAAAIEESKEDSRKHSTIEDGDKNSTAEDEASLNSKNDQQSDNAMNELQESINRLLGHHDTEMVDAFDSANLENASSIAEELVNSLRETSGEDRTLITENSVADEINKVLAAATVAAENATASSESQEVPFETTSNSTAPQHSFALESQHEKSSELPSSTHIVHESISSITHTPNISSSSQIINAPNQVPADEDLEAQKSRQLTNDNQRNKDVSEDFSNILLNALELALNGDHEENSEKTRELSEPREVSGSQESLEPSSNDKSGQSGEMKEEESEFDLDTIQELLRSAEHISTKDSENTGSSKLLDEEEKEDTHMEDIDRSGDHEEILAQLSSLLHPEDVDEPMGTSEDSADVIDALTSALGNQDEEKEDEEESNQIDINLFVSAIQSALEEAQVESRVDEGEEQVSDDQKSTFSKLEIQDALKSITDADGSLLLDLSSKGASQRPVSSQPTDVSNVDDGNSGEDDEENIRSTANLVEVLFQSGLLNADSLPESAAPKSKTKPTQRSTTISSAVSRGKNIRVPRTTASSQYNSTMSIAETLAYTRSHMSQKPKEAKIDPMVTRRELNRTALLKARQISQSRSSSRAAPTYYVPPQSQSSLDKELSYRLYTPSTSSSPSSSLSSSKPSSSSNSQRGQFHSATDTFNRGSQSSAGTRKRPPKTRFYYYTPPTSKSSQNGQERPGPSFAANAPRPQSEVSLVQSGGQNSEQGEHNLLAALLLAKRAFSSQGETSSEPVVSQPIGTEKSTSDLVDAETMKAIQAALEAVGNTLVDETKDKSATVTTTASPGTSAAGLTPGASSSTAQPTLLEKSATSTNAVASSSSSTLPPLPPLPPPTYPDDSTVRSSSSTSLESASPHVPYTSTTQIRRSGSRRKVNNGSNIMTADERERVRIENRERKKRWRGQNMDRNRDNDLRGRVTRRATQIYGAANTPQKMKWIEAEFQSRKLKRLERGVIDSFSFANFKGSKAANPVQSVMPEGAQQRFGSTEPEGSGNKSNTPDGGSEFINGFQATVSWSNNKSEEEDTRTTRSTQPPIRRNSGTARAKPVSSGGTNPSFFASRGAKAPTPLPMGGIVTSFKLKTNRPATQKKSHLFNVPKAVEPINLPNSSSSDNPLSLKRKRTISSNPSSASSLSSIALYSAGLIPPHLLPPDVSPVPLPKPLPFNGPSSSKKPVIVKPSYSSSSSIDLTKSPSPATRSSLLSTVQSVTDRFQDANKTSSSEASSSAQSSNSNVSASPTPASTSPRSATPIAEDKRVRAMGFPPILTGMTLRR